MFLSYTNPTSPGDPVVQELNQGHHPTGTLTTTDILTNAQTGTNSDTDSLKTTPNGSLVLTSEGDGPGSGSDGVITLISKPGTSSQSMQNVLVTDGHGNNVQGMDDVLFPSATSGELFFTDGANNDVYEALVSGLDFEYADCLAGQLRGARASRPRHWRRHAVHHRGGRAGRILSSPHGIDFIPAAVPGAGEPCPPGGRLRGPTCIPAARRLAAFGPPSAALRSHAAGGTTSGTVNQATSRQREGW